LAKKKVEAPKHEFTKRQLTHRQRESRIQRFTLWGGIAIIIIVLALVGTGLFLNKVKPNQQVVFKVGDTSYNMGYYIDSIDYYGQANYPYFQNLGMKDYSQFLGYMIKSFANTIQENQILKEAAAKMEPSIVVTDDEINQFIKDNKSTKNRAVKDAAYAALLDKKLTDKFDKALPATAEQRAVLAMFLESQSQIDEVKTRLEKGETFNDIAASSSLDSTTKNKSGDLGWVPAGVIPTFLNNADDKTLESLIFSPDTKVNVLTQIEDPTKSKSIGYWIIQVTDYKTVEPSATPAADSTSTAGTTEIQVNAMLLGSQELALSMKKQLQSGADFATVAKANSKYTNASEDGGILGYIGKGKLGTAVDAVIFPDDTTKMLTRGQITDPIADTAQSTAGGFWLAHVTGIENKVLDGTNRSTLTNIAKQAWRNQTWTENSFKVTDMLDEEKMTYASTQAVNHFNKIK
jgi:parvulin-like peptidyl-prolyl isomerase